MDFGIELLFRQTIVGYSPAEHAPGCFVHLEDRYRVSFPPQEISSGQTSRTGPDNGNPDAGVRHAHRFI